MPEQPFWAERWKKNELGFHALEVNPHLKKHIETLCPQRDKKVLVPLCGKTLDLIFLGQHFGEVWGVEYVERAAIDFFNENNIEASTEKIHYGKLYKGQNIRIVVADIFTFLKETPSQFDALYDRAALIALEKEKRTRYTQLLRAKLHEHAALLMIALDYPQEEMTGPPFSVSTDELNAHFEAYCELKVLENKNILQEESRWRERGVTCMHETVLCRQARLL